MPPLAAPTRFPYVGCHKGSSISPSPATPPASNAQAAVVESPRAARRRASTRQGSRGPIRPMPPSRRPRARSHPAGVLIDLPHKAVDERVKLTRKLIDDGAPAIFEASFLADNTFVASMFSHPRMAAFTSPRSSRRPHRKRSTFPTPRCRSTSSRDPAFTSPAWTSCTSTRNAIPRPVEPLRAHRCDRGGAAALGQSRLGIDAQLAI